MKKLEDFQEMVDNLRPNKPLDEETMMMWMQLMMSTNPELDELMTVDDPMFKEGAMQVPAIFMSRLQSLTTLKITRKAAVAIIINLSSAGSAVMYAYYLHRKCAPESTVDMNLLSTELFPWGMISEKQMEELWDAQKLWTNEEEKEAESLQCYMVKDNLLDYIGAWKEVEVKA